MNKYKEVSQEIFQIYKKFTHLVEPLSLDEAFLDVSDCPLHKASGTLIAQAIKKEIFEKTQLTASAGIAPNKFLAKIFNLKLSPNHTQLKYIAAKTKVIIFCNRLYVNNLISSKL